MSQLLALFGACRARHCACDVLPAPRGMYSTRVRCLALFSSRKGAWHRSHRVPRSADSLNAQSCRQGIHALRPARSRLGQLPGEPSHSGFGGSPRRYGRRQQPTPGSAAAISGRRRTSGVRRLRGVGRPARSRASIRRRRFVVVKKDPLTWCFEVVHLAALRRPDERDNAGNGEQQGDRQGDVDHAHRYDYES